MTKCDENKKSGLLRLIYVIGLVFCFTISEKGLAEQSRGYAESPEKVVEKFCQMDSEGYRLSHETWNKISPLVAWTEEAGDVFSVISNFKVGKAIIGNSTAMVPVEYNTLGSTNTIDFTEDSKKIRKITFVIKKQNGIWKIQEPVTAPHVNWKVAIEYIMKIKKAEPAREKALNLIIQKIKKAAGKL